MNRRFGDILRACVSPQTLYDLSNKFGVSYHTIRRDVVALVDFGYLQESSFRDGKRKQYVIANKDSLNEMEIGELLLPNNSGESTPVSKLVSFLLIDDSVDEAQRDVGRAICWQLLSKNPLTADGQKIEPEKLITYLLAIKTYFSNIMASIDVLINAPIWGEEIAWETLVKMVRHPLDEDGDPVDLVLVVSSLQQRMVERGYL